jgi:hypothetical protein
MSSSLGRATKSWVPSVTAVAMVLLALAVTETATAAPSSHETTTARNGGTGGSAEPSLTIPKPANVSPGNVLLAQVTFQGGNEISLFPDITVTPPVGWNALVLRTNFGSDLGQAIYYKFANAAEPASYSWQFRKGMSLEAVLATGGIIRYTGVNPSGPIVAANGGSGDTNPLRAPSVNTVANSMLVGFFGVKKQTTLTTPVNPATSPPAAMSNLYFQQHGNGSGPTIRAAQELRTAAGATGERRSTAGSIDKWVAQQVALRGNTVPVYGAPANQGADEGESKAFNLGSFADPDPHAKWDVTVDWGDGTDPEGFEVSAAGPLGTRNHSYADDGSYTVRVTVDDGVDSHSATFAVTVDNVAPTASFGNDGPVDEGSSFTLSLSNADDASSVDAAAGFEYAFDCGQGYGNFGSDPSAQCATSDDGVRPVAAKISDKDGGVREYTATVTVHNVAPSAAPPEQEQQASEGESTAFHLGSFGDPGANDGPWTVTVDWGDGSGEETPPEGATSAGPLDDASHTYADNGAYEVTVTVTDNDGGEGSAAFTVTVANAAPAVTAAPDQEVQEDALLELHLPPGGAGAAGTFEDPGFDGQPGGTVESFTATIDWGDGTSAPEQVTPTWESGSPGVLTSGLVQGSHPYADDGEYTVTVEVCDDDGGCGRDHFVVTVVAVDTSNESPVTEYALLANQDLEISGSAVNVFGHVHSNRNVKISGSGGLICGNITAVGTVRNAGSQCRPDYTTTPAAAPVTLPNMADYVPSTAAATHTLTGDRTLNGYSCSIPAGCIVWVKGKLEIRGGVTGKVWFLVDKEAIVKGSLTPADEDSRIQIYSKLNVESPNSKVTVEGVFLAERELKLSGSDQTLRGLFWAKNLVDMSGSRNHLTGAAISHGLLKLSGSNRSVTYDGDVIRLSPAT